MIRWTIASRSLAASVVLAVCGASTAAAEPSSSDRALAETLFREARKLMAEGNFASACPKLEESQRLDPGGGTLLNLGLCHEQEGKTASAWAELKEALAVAHNDGRGDRVEIAKQALAKLEPRLSRIQIVVDPSPPAGFEVTRNGSPMSAAVWGVAVPVDPGSHQIVARARGKRPWQVTVEVRGDGDTRAVHIPRLVDETTAPPVFQPAAPPGGPDTGEDPGATRRMIGYAVGGAGVLSLAVGTVFGVRAITKRQESNKQCGDEGCTEDGFDLNEQAKSAATVANVTIGLGLAGVAGGLVLVLTAPSRADSATSASVGPVVGPGRAGLLVHGRFQ